MLRFLLCSLVGVSVSAATESGVLLHRSPNKLFFRITYVNFFLK
jgi:hypothetical protein